MKHLFCSLLTIAATLLPWAAKAQSEIYPQHFDLEEVTLLEGPMRTALTTNNKLLLQYDTDRLLTPFVRQAGLTTGKYKNWVAQHPSFPNWGQSDWSLEGHIGGHYLTALALAYAATDDATTKTKMKERLDYMLAVLKDCQDAYDGNTQGMEGFLGGQPINQIWTGLYQGDLGPFKQYGGWVPFYCQHKVLAGLRDAWLYTDSELARDLFRKMCDWSVNVVKNLNDSQMQDILGWEHGGMNEPLADAYRLFGEEKYLTAAKKYSHQWEINGMQTLNKTFLDGQHANTQVPKFIGFERIYQEAKRAGKASTVSSYRTAAHNFWLDVAQNRTVCIGGNSVSEHFLAASRGSQYIDNLDGPESCNTNNMLKLSEDLFDETHDARYADFYEAATWNHILSTQDPKTGGYVYFTTLRPQGYRIYSQVNQGMWCCVGTGMENHSKYGHFIYTHSEDNKTLYVNLFIASTLKSEHFGLTQQTQFPYSNRTQLTINKGGEYTLAVRHPAWTTADYSISVNDIPVELNVQAGTASYATITRTWTAGDVVTVSLPMELRYEECPNYGDYIAFKYGPILLAAQTTSSASSPIDGLAVENLQNEYGGEGRMDHAPGARAKSLKLSSAPLLIGERQDVLSRVERNRDGLLSFTLRVNRGNWTILKLVPFYTIHHARYACYFYQQTQENYELSDMGRADAEAALLETRTLDFVATGEQQSEAGHQGKYSSDSNKGSYNGEFYRDAQKGGWFSYTLDTQGQTDSIAILVRFTTADKGRVGTMYIDGRKLATVTIPSTHVNAEDNGFYNEEYAIPSEWLEGKQSIVFRFVASGTTPIPGLYYLRLVNRHGYDNYRFVCTDWTTGDANRVAANKFTYDTAANTIRINANTGNNNVCLMMTTEGKKYMVQEALKYLVVKGTNLNTGSGKNYLWWLNGVNRGSSVAPTVVKRAADGDVVVAWDLTQSGLDDNCKGSSWNFATGQTIFGMTATRTPVTISYIGFQSSVDEYLESVGIHGVENEESGMKDGKSGMKNAGIYDLQGRRISVSSPLPKAGSASSVLPKGVYIKNGKKVVIGQ